MTALKKLTINSLRGSVQPFSLPFEKGKGVTIVYGENGTGKSTICDALEFIGKGAVGSLNDRGLGQSTRYWPSMDKDLGDITVSLETTAGTCEARVGKNGIVVALPPDQRPVVEVFRRRQILDPIEAKPAERYEAIRGFVDVSSVEAGEAALRQLIKELRARRDSAAERVGENLGEIERLWDTAGKPGVDALEWAEAEAARDSAAIDGEAKAIDDLHLAYKKLEPHPNLITSATQEVTAAQTRSALAEDRVQKQIAAVAQDAAETVAILQAAKPFLARVPSPASCPLCESTERTVDLGSRVDARLSSFQTLVDAQAAKGAAAEVEARALERLNAERDALARDALAFESTRAQHIWPTDIRLPLDAAPDCADLAAQWLERAAPLAADWASARDKRRARGQSLASLRRALDNWRDNRKTAEEITAILPRLDLALSATAEERRAFTDEVLSEISDEVGRLYESIHPGEGLAKIALQLDPKRRASLEIGAEFQGQQAKPQAYFSDSHLDTLGLCVLLALASREKPDEKILVLDDVLASADEPHIERLVGVLYAEAAKFRHCIITTHYRPWREKLRWGTLKTGECHFVELSRWSIAQGITLTGSIPEIARLRRLLADTQTDLQTISAKSGVILEATLDFLTRLYECRAPRRAGNLTLGDLLQAIDKKLRQALRVEIRSGKGPDGTPTFGSIALGPLIEDIEKVFRARNLFGCHFNELSFHLPDSDALAFGQKVLELAEALVDLEEGWPKSDKSGSYWETTGGTRRLHPLQQPR